MKQRENRASILCAFLFLILLVMAGCASDASHQYGPLQQAVPASFFGGGSIAHYQCADCGQLFTEQKVKVDTVATPRLSHDLSICVNGNAAQLTLEGQSASHITWSLEGLSVEAGDQITICDTADRDLIYPYRAEGNIDEEGKIKHSTADAAVALVATPNGLALSILHQGIVVEINGEQYPMHCTGNETYVYDYRELHRGDRLVVIDNGNGITYGHDDLAEAYEWNSYDYHRGENGEFVIDHEGRYALALRKDGNEQVYIRKAFAPLNGNGYRIVFSGADTQTLPMEEMQLAQGAEAASALIPLPAGQNSDTADHIAQNGLHAYSAAVFLEAGTKFYIEDTAGSVQITGDHLTDVFGVSNCFRLEGDHIALTQSGTYHILYLPAYNSISIEQLSTGSITDAAKEFDKKIALLPSSLEIYYEDEIKQLYKCYLRLPESIKPLLKTSAKLETLYRNVLALESASSVIYYMNTENTDHVYRSKEALFQAFFTDFYYYIVAYHGTSRLKAYEINDVDDFLELAGNGDGSYGSGLNALGSTAGIYFLESESNGILENQSENSFLGFCCQNGLYRELLPFLIRFFAYWRIDEGYATVSNCGADLFAEGWAPTVDIAKFFYYDETTSYVRSERMLDCFTNTAGVVYGLDSGALPDIKLRGYIFEGWYDNPECSGSPLSHLPLTDEAVRLYAKWSMDADQQDQDSAGLVDVYIYNLTTQSAVINSATVGHVKEMYDGLTPNAKQLVTLYGALERLAGLYL